MDAKTVQHTGRVIAACFALSGFAIALVAGIMAGNPAITVLWRAICVLAICQLVGHALGAVLEHVAVEASNAYRAAHPETPLDDGSPLRSEEDSTAMVHGKESPSSKVAAEVRRAA